MSGLTYVPPSAAYVAGLVAEMREAAVKALDAKNRYEAREAHIMATVRENWLRQKWMQQHDVQYHIRAGKDADTPLKDAGILYEFWKGEQMRISALIQGEIQGQLFIMEAAQNDHNSRLARNTG